MAGKLLIDAHYSDETRIAIVDDDGNLENFEVEYSDRKPIKGNIYLAKVVRIEPAIQAAFINYGGDKNGFLPLSEIHYDYFNQNILKSMEKEDTEEYNDDDEKKPHRHLKIQEVISPKQIILVQAEKEIRGNKCAFFTTFISLPGRYCVLVPNPPKGKSNAISKKIDHSEKERLRGIMESLDVPEGMNCIIRTAGESRTKQEIKRDLEYLCRLWNEIRGRVTSSVAPCLIHEEGNIVKRGIRDLYQRSMEKIIVQGKDAYKDARSFMKTFTPSHAKKIEMYNDSDAPIFHKYGIEDKIGKILEPTVKLPSGGTIVINTTEALTAIDVNSGKSKDERDIEETALKTNLEAAVEIARQIKLRDIAGIIVIDFIDMTDRQSDIKVEKKMREVMKDDYSSLQFSKLSQFGLMEISRQRLRTSLADATFIQCNHCLGSGKVLANDTIALSVIRKIENFLVTKSAKVLVVEVAPGVDLFILNKKRNLLSEMEQNYGVSLEITRNVALSAMDCKFLAKEYKPRDNSKEAISKDSIGVEIEPEIVNKSNVKKQQIKTPQKAIEEEQQQTPQKKSKKKLKKASNNPKNVTDLPIVEQDPKTQPVVELPGQSEPKQQKKSPRNNKRKKVNAGAVESEQRKVLQSQQDQPNGTQKAKNSSIKPQEVSKEISPSSEVTPSNDNRVPKGEVPQQVETKSPSKSKKTKTNHPRLKAAEPTSPDNSKVELVFRESEEGANNNNLPVNNDSSQTRGNKRKGWLRKIFNS